VDDRTNKWITPEAHFLAASQDLKKETFAQKTKLDFMNRFQTTQQRKDDTITQINIHTQMISEATTINSFCK
jgi:hypothetical protein